MRRFGSLFLLKLNPKNFRSTGRVPSSAGLTSPFSITPTFKNAPINRSTLLSVTRPAIAASDARETRCPDRAAGSPPGVATLFPRGRLRVIRQGEHPKDHASPVAATTHTPTNNCRTGEGAAAQGCSILLVGCRLHRRESRGRRETNSSSHTLAAVHQTPTASFARPLIVDR